ncbi:unnamed protein product [Rotaria sordida]|uniref:Uncharacterized protein n=1 Tax=Rotaria sordida TaxID=392033 RepID=A0A813YFA1_9BILA|nr:unnamed protein product [Rotaria sordida]CAF0983717.1 unnamed protein product [Rotaria sordida]CAF3692000.1 unnamed protein product [Rotaria sordida]CAF3708597.1 unnamed protein product [Rotaria sordida]
MKSKDLQNIVLSKYQNGDTPTKIYHDLNGDLGLTTIKRWCQMIRRTGSIQLSSPPGGPLWDELVNTIDWDKVKSKTTLIQQLKSSVKKIRESVVFESCASWTNRLYRVSQNDGNYLR